MMTAEAVEVIETSPEVALEQPPRPTSATLYEAWLKKRQATNKFDPSEIRLSEVGHCLRAATLRILGYAAEPTTLRQESIFQKGDEEEDHIASWWEDEYLGQIDRQVEVQSPFGVGHMDIWVKPLRHYIESKSTTLKSLRYLPNQDHVEQVMLYHHYYIQPTGGGTAELVYRVKETGLPIVFPIVYDREYAEELVARLQTVKDAVEFGVPLPVPKGNYLDQFPCGWWNDDGEFTTCAFWKHCWVPEARDTTSDPATIEALLRYERLEGVHKRAEARMKAIAEKREALRASLGQLMDQNGQGVVRAGGLEVVRLQASGWMDYNARAAIQAGVVSKAAMKPYERPRQGNVTWKVRDLAELASRRRKKKGD